MTSNISTYLSASAADRVSRTIRELGWDDESIACAAFIPANVGLIKRARSGDVREIAKSEQIAFYRLLTFLGLSKDELHFADTT